MNFTQCMLACWLQSSVLGRDILDTPLRKRHIFPYFAYEIHPIDLSLLLLNICSI